jgi:hypothetical protein
LGLVPGESFAGRPIVEAPSRADLSPGRLMLLTGAALAAGLVADVLMLRDPAAG